MTEVIPESVETAEADGLYFDLIESREVAWGSVDPAVPSMAERGWEVQVRDMDRQNTLLAVVPEYVELSVGPELSAPGAGSVSIDLDTPFWDTNLTDGKPATDLLERECLWEAYEDGLLRFQWIGHTVRESMVDDSEARVVSVSGPGVASVLDWAAVLPPGYPASTEYFWDFNPLIAPAVLLARARADYERTRRSPTSTPDNIAISLAKLRETQRAYQLAITSIRGTFTSMGAFLTLLRAAQARGTAVWIKPTFDGTHDSGKRKWDDKGHEVNFRPELGSTLLDQLDVCTGQDLNRQTAVRAEWVMRPGWKLEVRRQVGSHREDRVVFTESGSDLAKSRTRLREDVRNYVVIRDVFGKTSLATDSASRKRWARREMMEQRGNVTDAARRRQLASVVLAQHKAEASSWTLRAAYGVTGRHPFVDFGLGDYVGVQRFNGRTTVSTVEVFRVLAIVIHVSDAGTQMELTLQSKFEQRQTDLARQLTAVNNALGSGGLLDSPDVSLPADMPDALSPLTWDPDTDRWGLGTFPSGSGCEDPAAYPGCVYIQADEPPDAKTGSFWLDL